MNPFLTHLTRMRLWYDDEAQDLVEYALLAGLVAVAAALFAPDLSASMKAIYSRVASRLTETANLC